MRSLKFLSGVFALALAFSAGIARPEPVKIRVAWVTPVANRASILFERPGLARHMGKSYTFEAVSPTSSRAASRGTTATNFSF